MTQREQDLQVWVENFLGERTTLVPLANDASFRKYYRAKRARQSWVVMDAPPPKEDLRPFIAVAQALSQAGLMVPTIVASDLPKGFLLVSDFGDTLYYEALRDKKPDDLYFKAMAAILEIQALKPSENLALVPFDDAFIFTELGYFKEWFLERYLRLQLNRMDEILLEQAFLQLASTAREQPRVLVHRDYHSRNLMLLPEGEVGILDFQDAVWGPITYDLVSLLKDCYLQWPRERVLGWAKTFWSMQLKPAGTIEWATFLRWFDIMGLQRHLKVLGIFSRLYLRDQKPRYLADMPRIMSYVLEVTALYPEYSSLHTWLEQVVLAHFQEQQCVP